MLLENSTLNLTKTYQEEKDEITKQLQLERDSVVQNMQNTQGQLQQKIIDLEAKLDEEKRATLLQTEILTKKLNIEKKAKNKLDVEISHLKDKVTEVIECQSLSTIKQLVKQNQELADLLERTNSNLNAYKIKFNELLDSLNKEHVSSSNIDDVLQKFKEDRNSISVNLHDTENRMLSIKQSLQKQPKIEPTDKQEYHSGTTDKVG